MKCVIANCGNHAVNYFGVRLRYPPKGKAWWAPNTGAYVCNMHAKQGMKITVELEETLTKSIETQVSGVGTAAIVRKTPIKS